MTGTGAGIAAFRYAPLVDPATDQAEELSRSRTPVAPKAPTVGGRFCLREVACAAMRKSLNCLAFTNLGSYFT